MRVHVIPFSYIQRVECTKSRLRLLRRLDAQRVSPGFPECGRRVGDGGHDAHVSHALFLQPCRHLRMMLAKVGRREMRLKDRSRTADRSGHLAEEAHDGRRSVALGHLVVEWDSLRGRRFVGREHVVCHLEARARRASHVGDREI